MDKKTEIGGINMSNICMIIPYKKKNGQFKFLLKNEFIPGWDQHPDTCGISLPTSENNHENEMISFLSSELNLIVDEPDLIRLGVCAIKRNSDHICYLYAVDLSKREFEPEMKTKSDGKSEVYQWSNADQLVESIDPQLLSGYLRLKYLVFD